MSRLIKMARRGLDRVLQKRGYGLHRLSRIQFFEPLLYSCLKRVGDLVFVQIGANDGKMCDPLYEFVTWNQRRVSGIVVEPVRECFEQLRINYAKYPSITPVNTAIHNSEKEMMLYRVDPARATDLPRWARGIASFDPHHHARSGIPADAIISEKVRCMTLAELLAEHHVARIDLLQIDAEGYDGEIIHGIDFQRMKPAILRFEHGLSEGIMSRETFRDIVELLHANEYELVVERHDATAYQRTFMTEAR